MDGDRRTGPQASADGVGEAYARWGGPPIPTLADLDESLAEATGQPDLARRWISEHLPPLYREMERLRGVARSRKYELHALRSIPSRRRQEAMARARDWEDHARSAESILRSAAELLAEGGWARAGKSTVAEALEAQLAELTESRPDRTRPGELLVVRRLWECQNPECRQLYVAPPGRCLECGQGLGGYDGVPADRIREGLEMADAPDPVPLVVEDEGEDDGGCSEGDAEHELRVLHDFVSDPDEACRREERFRRALDAIASMEGETMSEAGDAVDIARDALEAVEGDGVATRDGPYCRECGGPSVLPYCPSCRDATPQDADAPEADDEWPWMRWLEEINANASNLVELHPVEDERAAQRMADEVHNLTAGLRDFIRQSAEGQSTKVEDLHPICRETHEEIVAWLEALGVHVDLGRKQTLYQWLEKYAAARRLRQGGGESGADLAPGEAEDLDAVIAGCERWHEIIEEEGADTLSEDHHRIGLRQLLKDCHRWLTMHRGRLRDAPSEEGGGERERKPPPGCTMDPHSADYLGEREERPGGGGRDLDTPRGRSDALNRAVQRLADAEPGTQEADNAKRHLNLTVGDVLNARLRDAAPEERPGGSGEPEADRELEILHDFISDPEEACRNEASAALSSLRRRLRRSTPDGSQDAPDCEMCGGPDTEIVYSRRQDKWVLLCTECLILGPYDGTVPPEGHDDEPGRPRPPEDLPGDRHLRGADVTRMIDAVDELAVAALGERSPGEGRVASIREELVQALRDHRVVDARYVQRRVLEAVVALTEGDLDEGYAQVYYAAVALTGSEEHAVHALRTRLRAEWTDDRCST